MVLARPDEQETWPYHCSLRLFMMVRRSSCGQVACWILAQTSSLVTWSLYEMRGILQQHLISMACILLKSSAVRVHDSQAYRKMDLTRQHISRILELREILLSFQTGFNLVNAAVVCAILKSISGLESSSYTHTHTHTHTHTPKKVNHLQNSVYKSKKKQKKTHRCITF